jgi:hypothetical protein
MFALTRILRPTALGGLLSLLFGITLIIGGLSARDAAGGDQLPTNYCGETIFSAVGVALPTSCPVGTITITKVKVGDGTVPDGGFTVVITSDNCQLPGKTDSIAVLVSPGDTTKVTDLYQYAGLLNSQERNPCVYSVMENAAPGWTATYAPAGPVQLPQNDQAITNVTVVVTNTGTTPTPTPTPTTSIPTTSAPASSVAPAPSTSAPALASTGRSSTTPQLILGGALCLLGLGLVIGTRPKASHA